ncbi:MAG: hypothetical protein ACREOY_11360 [Candidatus Dormibacteraceae bacterium]
MWPTQLSGSTRPSRWSDRGLRSRAFALLGIAALVAGAAIAIWFSMRGGQSSTPTLYGAARQLPAALWTWDGTAYTMRSVPAAGPSSNYADMAYDRTRSVIVLWDHGCTSLVMGFQGGCVNHINRTWTWDGSSWTAQQTQSSPTAAGQGAMLFDGKLGKVVYVNGSGQAWAWGGSDWSSLALPGGPSVPVPGSGAQSVTFVAGYDEGRDVLVFVLPGATWLWDGARWKEVPGGIAAGEARTDADVVYDRAGREMVYVGRRATWTWDGSRWQQHAQPGVSAGTMAYDPARATVMLVVQDSSDCDHTACQATTWDWDSTAWVRVPVQRGPMLPLTRSGAYGMPMAFDEARGVMVLFASAS